MRSSIVIFAAALFIFQILNYAHTAHLCVFYESDNTVYYKNLVHYVSSRTQLESGYNYMFRPYMWAILRLRSNFSGVAIEDVSGVFEYWSLGGRGEGGQDLVCTNSGYHDLGLLQVDYH